ncbi:nucleotidyltransferase domain-containing protein [Mesorhizobium sp.]
MKLWIERALRRNVEVVNFYFFGSILTPTRNLGDVDVVVVFSAWDQYNFLMDTCRSFRCRFGIPFTFNRSMQLYETI